NYSAGGEMDYLRRHEKDFKQLMVTVNIDDVGFIHGKSAYSFYQLPKGIRRRANGAFGSFEGLVAGEPWAQGDHMMFVQKGIPAMAITSERFPELMATVTHTAKDVPDLIDCTKLVEVASALERFIVNFR
ncbi:MAG: Zn-dependent exopeptidase M28, partial [Coprothermobacterota bacterium]|nr:Zn-dependent exopeptidase M28 [Coprothermobacterota bacterium]